MDGDKLIEELKRDEGVRLKPYRCSAGYLTIGCGRNLDIKGIRPNEAELMLANDVAEVITELDQYLPWWRELTGVRQRVLANMAFNLGAHGLLGFKHAIALIRDGQYEAAAEAMLDSKWAKQVGERAERLAEMMRKGA